MNSVFTICLVPSTQKLEFYAYFNFKAQSKFYECSEKGPVFSRVFC